VNDVVLAKQVSRNVIAEVAPAEVGAFDAMWSDYEKSPEIPLGQAARSERAHGADASITTTLVSTVVIPVVVALLKEGAKPLVKEVVDRIRKMRGRDRADDDDTKLAEKIVAVIRENHDGRSNG